MRHPVIETHRATEREKCVVRMLGVWLRIAGRPKGWTRPRVRKASCRGIPPRAGPVIKVVQGSHRQDAPAAKIQPHPMLVRPSGWLTLDHLFVLRQMPVVPARFGGLRRCALHFNEIGIFTLLRFTPHIVVSRLSPMGSYTVHSGYLTQVNSPMMK